MPKNTRSIKLLIRSLTLDSRNVGKLTVEANAVRLAVEASGTYLKAISLLIVLCDLRNSIDDDEDMILIT